MGDRGIVTGGDAEAGTGTRGQGVGDLLELVADGACDGGAGEDDDERDDGDDQDVLDEALAGKLASLGGAEVTHELVLELILGDHGVGAGGVDEIQWMNPLS